jgi:hypothetical protein
MRELNRPRRVDLAVQQRAHSKAVLSRRRAGDLMMDMGRMMSGLGLVGALVVIVLLLAPARMLAY